MGFHAWGLVGQFWSLAQGSLAAALNGELNGH